MRQEGATIRRAPDSDASVVYRLIAQLQRSGGVAVPPEATFVRQFGHALRESRFRAFVAEEAGEIQGVITVWLRKNLFHTGSVALIDELVVEEDRRGRGIGSELAEHVVGLCRRLGCAEVEVSTEADNCAARTSYVRHGLVEEGVLLEREL